MDNMTAIGGSQQTPAILLLSHDYEGGAVDTPSAKSFEHLRPESRLQAYGQARAQTPWGRFDYDYRPFRTQGGKRRRQPGEWNRPAGQTQMHNLGSPDFGPKAHGCRGKVDYGLQRVVRKGKIEKPNRRQRRSPGDGVRWRFALPAGRGEGQVLEI